MTAAGVRQAGRNRRNVLAYLAEVGPYGATWRDISERLGVHHGVASGALSLLHRDGRVKRLRETRGGSRVYVLPWATLARETESYGRTVTPSPAQVEAFLAAWAEADAAGRYGERVLAGLTAALNVPR